MKRVLSKIEKTVLENQKRKREIILIFCLSLLVVFLTWFEIRLFATSQKLPFVHSIFFFGLVNFNIILLLLLLFFIFRNVVKVFLESKGGVFGSSLKSKLVAAFSAFSFIPTLLVFVISVFYINASFDKWFSVKMVGILKSSLEVQNAFYFNTKQRNYHFAHEIADRFEKEKNLDKNIPELLQKYQKDFSLDVVEFYPSKLAAGRILKLSEDSVLTTAPALPDEFLKRGFKNQAETSLIQPFREGNLVRALVPVRSPPGAIVVSSFVPLSLISRINDVSAAYEEFRDLNPIEYPLKSIYIIVLVLMTLVILFAATWFGFYLARELSTPLVALGEATQRVAGGDYTPVEINTGSKELNILVTSFNKMTQNLASSENHLKGTLNYLEVVLRNVSTGVIAIDKTGRISNINQHAADLMKIKSEQYIGRPVRDLLNSEYFRIFAELLKSMQENQVDSIQREFKLDVDGETLPLLMNLSILRDQSGESIGKVLVFDDLSQIVNAQRAAAWTEVARRIAHEVKNPLTPIQLSAERLRKRFGEQIKDPVFNECTSMIIQQVEDMKNLVNEFSQFARLPQTKIVKASMLEVVNEAAEVFRTAHPQVKLEINFDEKIPDFKFDPVQMKRVFVNLIDNALSACSDSSEPTIRIEAGMNSDLQVIKISIADNGVGIPSNLRARIFDPYFSTKPSGTGLGLSIVKRIIEDHNGFIRATEVRPRGTAIVIEMPLQYERDWKRAQSLV